MNQPLPQPGQTLHGFRVQATEPLPELNATLMQLRHESTGARYVHLATADPNNLFAVAFRTPPEDSTGVAHILEHTVLCGSQRFPVRDPFFSMLKRSLNTFMNALTSSDWTAYPFASQNRKDFANLLDIYLDAAFFPLLREGDFRQEGHRLEFAEPDNPDSELTFKGVVFNEMKGAMASPSSLLARRLGRALYPTTCYHHNSGGEPERIPDLTYEQLRDFHRRCYQPGNACFFSYGTFPLAGHLATIEDRVLSRFDSGSPAPAVPPEQRLEAPRRVTEDYPLDPGEPLAGKTMVQLGWLTCDVTDSFERLALGLLASLLLGNPAAPLYRALLDSRLGGNLAPGCGHHDDNRTTYFAAGLQATDPEQTEAIETLILETLERVAREGFAPERVEAAIHRLEFGHREVSGDHFPYPLGLLMRILGPWLHGDDPVSPLQLSADLARLRRELDAGPFFENLIRRHLLDNPHRVTLTLQPDPDLKQRREQALAERLAAIRTGLSAADRQRIVDQARELQKAQDQEEDLSCLPSLGRDDIPEKEIPAPGKLQPAGASTVEWFDQPTNGIGYYLTHLPTALVPTDLQPLIPLFCNILPHVGAAGRSYLEMAERMEAGTGGIQLGTDILEAPDDHHRTEGTAVLQGKALVRNSDKLFGILADLSLSADFTDLERLTTVLNQLRTNLENSIPGSGHAYAARAGAGRLTPGGRMRELWSGLSQLRRVRDLAERPAAELGEFAEQLQAIGRLLFNRHHQESAMTVEAAHFDRFRPDLAAYLEALPTDAGTLHPPEPFQPAPGHLGWETSVPVSYVTRIFPGAPYTSPDSAPLMVLARLLRAGFLHREIREKGGAYGGLASYDQEAGLFSLLSYRDPQLVRTLRVYDDAAAWAAGGSFASEDIDEAILAVFGALDRPLSPGSRGSQEFAHRRQGLTPELRQQLRERVLAVDRRQVMDAAERYLVAGRGQSVVSVVAGGEALQQANEELGDEALAIERI